MDRCDVIVVGGGPAGSSCAHRLVRAGCDVVILDKASFPRDKVCTGWITPAVVRTLELDLAEYAVSRTVQTFAGFKTGPIGGDLLLTDFHHTISYGIRRVEFDDYLLRRSGARLVLGRPLFSLRRDGDEWVANDVLRAPVIVGAGGHFCPIAHRINAGTRHEDVIVAQEIELRLDDGDGTSCRVSGEWPELFFWPDLLGYGWCVRKGNYLNIGAGHLSQSEFPARVRQFAAQLRERGVILDAAAGGWKGHAYLLGRASTRQVYDSGLLLAGDSAGVALAPSGEGILAAVESGLMAAEAILAAAQNYSRDRLAAYQDRIQGRFGGRDRASAVTRVPDWLAAIASRVLLGSPRLTRRLLLENGFLHVRRAAM
jgi:flavin-dependent dehydrogenase